MSIQYTEVKNETEFYNLLLKKINIDRRAYEIFSAKKDVILFLIENIKNSVANLLKQEMLSIGGDVAVSREVALFKKGTGSALIMGTLKNYKILIDKLKNNTSSLKNIANMLEKQIENLSSEQKYYFKIGKKIYRCRERIYLMGILNITPDSFYDGGRYINIHDAVKQALKFQEEGADFIDIGGESTRPGAQRVPVKEEIKRVIPVIKKLIKKVKIPISIDTYKSEVAEAAIAEGASIVNDISGLKFDKKMAKVIAKNNATVVLMHIKGKPANMQKNPRYKNLIQEIIDYLQESINIALDAGIPFENIIIDPGIGFGKTLEHNYIILNKLQELKILNRPILIGLSRKSLIGKILNNNPEERLNGTVILNTVAVLNSANILRVHDIKPHRELVKLIEFYYKNGGEWS